jgi:hypothetical protein
MEKITKFKNGNINITFNGTIEELEEFYNGDMFMSDLYLHHNGEAWFMIDTNKSNVYFINSYAMNIFEYLQEEFTKNKTLKFYPGTDKDEE